MRPFALLTLLGVFACCPFAHGIMIYEGTRELRAQGSYQFKSEDGATLDLRLGMGLFVIDGLQLGAYGAIGNSDHFRTYGVGVSSEYHFDSGTVLIPYVGLAAGWSESRLTQSQGPQQKENGGVVSGELGGKYFIAENIAISLAYRLEWANKDIFFDQDEAEDTDHSIQMGMRFYF